jgi:hypothetical protein
VARRYLAHGGQLLRGSGQGGLDRGDFTEPALILGFLETVGQVGVDLFQPWHLGRVDAKERASDTGFSELQARGHGSTCGSLGPRIAAQSRSQRLMRLRIDNAERPSRTGPITRSAIRSVSPTKLRWVVSWVVRPSTETALNPV